MKRQIAATLVFLIFCSVFLVCLSIPVFADSLYIRKIVSVVYDDSGSMNNGGSVNWAYASYAMQAFCGLLNSDDQLFITYMSEAESNPNLDPPGINLSESAIQSSVDSIREHTEEGNTPLNAIDIAFNKLKSVEDPNINTQYWLVVVTDGAFQNASGGVVQASELSTKLNAYASAVMPNQSTPQITYLAIGDKAIKPDTKPDSGVHVYESSGAGDIVKVMATIADKISGRSRLQTEDIVKKSGNTIEIESQVPLMNISVLSQKTDAKITGASYSGGSKLNVSRSVSISYPVRPGWVTDETLSGNAFLIGSPSSNIDAGSYTITFSGDVSPDDIVVMFEPALEVRMQILLNGKEVSDHQKLKDGVSEGDKITISCKIYEMGTDKEVSPDLLPTDTRFELDVLEDGNVAEKNTGKEMKLSDYSLKKIETEIKAAMTIPGFNPIEYSVKFTPTEYVPKVVYTLTSEFANEVKSIKYDDIPSNQDFSISFTVYADGIAITDPDEVKALHPVVQVTPEGNDGIVSYTSDGKIVFTPDKASTAAAGTQAFSVEVSCTLDDGTEAGESYTVLIADYEVVAVGTDKSIKKTEFFDNPVGTSFYVTKDGVKLDKAAVEKDITVLLNEEHSKLKTRVEVTADGTITVTPYSDEEHSLNFGRWFINWFYYIFSLEGKDVTVTLRHAYGTASSTIDVRGEDIWYLSLNVILPLALEAAVLLFLIWWVYCILAKPKFPSQSALYMGGIYFDNATGRHHEITTIREYPLSKYNALKYRLGLTPNPKKISLGNGIIISASPGGGILCHCQVWYSGEIQPLDDDDVPLENPAKLKGYMALKLSGGRLNIEELSPLDPNGVKQVTSIRGPKNRTYYVHTTREKCKVIGGIDTIERGYIFAYAIRPQNG